MANNCLSTIKLVGNKADISALYTKLSSLYEITNGYYKSYIEACFGRCPYPIKPPEVLYGKSQLDLCDVVAYFGGDNSDVDCRGFVEEFELFDETTIKIYTDTAYVPMQEVWAIVIVEYESLKYFFISEEIGSECFYNNDRSGDYFSDKYFIDNQFGSETECVNSDKWLLEYMNKWLDVGEIKNLEELDIWLELFNEQHELDTIRYYPYLMPEPCIPNLIAEYHHQSKKLQIYHFDKCILDESGVEDYKDMDYWNALEYRGDMYDVHFFFTSDGKYFLCIYPVIDGSVDCSVW